MKPVPEPTATDFDELLAFQGRLCAPGFEPVLKWYGGRQEDGSFQMPYPEYDPVIGEFMRAVSKECWQDYEYTDNIQVLRSDLSLIASANLQQLRTVLTFIVRGERFADGHWAEMLSNGLLCAALSRLTELRADE